MRLARLGWIAVVALACVAVWLMKGDGTQQVKVTARGEPRWAPKN
jgi:hypothetical protein